MRKGRKRYLITVAANEERRNKPPLTHTRYHVTENRLLADSIAGDFAEDLARRRGPNNLSISPVEIKSVGPAKSRRKPSTLIGIGPRSDDRDMDRKAGEYALWLAKRDGIELPDGAMPRVRPGDVTSIMNPYTGKHERRIMSVGFYRVVEGVTRYSGARTESIDITIPLPNWDWFPAPPVYVNELAEEFRKWADEGSINIPCV